MIDSLLRDPLGALQFLILMVPGFLVAVTVHEVAHGWVAERLGDPTARLAGRLTFNPLPHIDPLGAVAFVLAGFGWARPVPVNARNLRRPVRDMALVAIAGPLSNFVTAFAALVLLVITSRVLVDPFVARPVGGMLQFVYTFNLGLGIFNLLPVPPLDGSTGITVLMSERMALRFLEFMRDPTFSMVGIVAAWFLFDKLFDPIFTFALNVLYPGAGYA